MHNEIRKKIQVSNSQYKIHADTHRHHAEFQVGDYVMIWIRLEWFPSRIVKKLQARSASPFKVLKRMGPNAYVIDLPHDYGISSSFNIEDLVAYKSPTIISESAEAFARHIHDLHNEICKKIQVSNSQYKIHADTR